ncbi:MAG: hypothetical protein RH917_15455 [Lacipirellulaceae bacterium]
MMRGTTVLGVGICVFAFAAMAWLASAQPTNRGQLGYQSTGGDLITHFQVLEGGTTQAILVDPQTKVMSVYHIGALGEEKGKIQLKSVRPLRWDMELNSYQTGKPLPEDLRNAAERSQ